MNNDLTTPPGTLDAALANQAGAEHDRSRARVGSAPPFIRGGSLTRLRPPIRGLACWIAAAALVAAAAAQPVELSDARSGMTCAHYDASARLAWGREGGDWRDADDAAHGPRPFVSQTVARTGGAQTLTWDVTELARRWADGAAPAGGVFVRQLADDASSVRLHSREAENAADRPRLRVTWSDGRTTEWAPTADATMTCTSASGKGDSENLHVGGRRSAALVFPFEARAGASVRRAELVLVSDRQYGRPSVLGVFRLHVPFAKQLTAQAGIAAGYMHDQGIAAHPAVVFAADFESAGWARAWSSLSDSSTTRRVARDPANRFEPLHGHALKVTVPQGKKTGLNLLYRFREQTGAEPEEMYFRYYLRFGDDWMPAVAGKLPGFAGTYGEAGWGGRRSDGTDGWSARGRYSLSEALDDGAVALGFYVYHAEMTRRYGDGWGWNLGPTGVLQRNRWYSVEQHVRLNTPGQDDGVLRAWIDGVPVFERSDLRFRESPALRIETVWMNVYHGGTRAAPQDLSLYIDNVVVAREYIGPAGGMAAGPAR